MLTSWMVGSSVNIRMLISEEALGTVPLLFFGVGGAAPAQAQPLPNVKKGN